MTRFLLWTLTLLALPLAAADWKAGFGRVDITPPRPIYLGGYGARNHPSTGVEQRIFAKALAIEDGKGYRVVIITTDLVALTRQITDAASAELGKRYKLGRQQVLFNASHTHSSPTIDGRLTAMFRLTPEEAETIRAYAARLTEQLVEAASAALTDLAPADLAVGHGNVGFSINRREFTDKGVKIGLNPKGPVDHDVPVIRVNTPDGKLRGVLFGYACHNTTLGGNLYRVAGDYAGYAQAAFEKEHPGTTAMFMLLAGADSNPNPRGTYELAARHGGALAAEVSRVIGGPVKPLSGALRSVYRTTELAFVPHTREKWEAEKNDPLWAKQQRAEAMLAAYDRGTPVRSTPYPIEGIRFGKQLTLIALGGELVVDYDLRLKKEFPGEDLIVAGYSNDVMCYIPSLRVLNEGGYEADDSMIYFGQPGRFTDAVEETIIRNAHQVLGRLGLKPR